MFNRNDAKNARPRRVPFPVKVAAWGTGVLLCLALPVLIALHSPSVQRKIIRDGIARIDKATHLKVKISSCHWNSFSRIYLTGVKIESGGKRILDCDDVRVDYRLSIERPYIVIEEVDLEKPFVKLERGADGKWLLPVFSATKKHETSDPPRSPASWIRLHLPRIKISAGTIEAVQQGKTVFSIKDFSGAVSFQAQKGAGGPKIRMELGKVHGRAHAAEFGTWDIDGCAVLDGHELLARKIVLSGPKKCHILVRGRWNIEDPENGAANLGLLNFSTGHIPWLQTRLGRLSGVWGIVKITRSAGKWTLAPDITTKIGTMRGVLDIEKTGAGPYAVSLDSRFSALKIDLPRGLADAKLNGWMKAKALMRGQDLLQADFKAHLGPSVVCARDVKQCDLRGTFANGVLNVVGTDARCSLADFEFTVNADMRGLTDSGHEGGIEAKIGLLNCNLDKIDPRVRCKLAGRISIAARYNPGDFLNPRLWRAKIDANLAVPDTLTLKTSGSYDNQRVKAVYDLDLVHAQKISVLFPKWRGKGRVVSHGSFEGKWPELLWSGEIDSPRFRYAALRADRLSIKGKGIISGKKERHVITIRAQKVVVDGKKFASVNLELDQQNNSCAFTFSGDRILDQVTARLSGKLENIWDFPRISVSTRGRLGWKKLSGAVAARFQVEKNRINIDSATLLYANGKISTSGGVLSQSNVRLPLSLDSIDAGKLSELLGLKNRLRGTISGRLQVSGRPERPECKLSIRGNNLVCNGQKIARLALQGDYSKKVLSLQGTATAAGISAPLSISGRVPVQLSLEPPRFQLLASAKLDSTLKFSGLQAKSVLPFLHGLSEAGGQLDGNIVCSGTLKEPVLNGEGTWKDGSLEVTRWPHAAQNIQARWRIDSKAIYLTGADLSQLGGNVSVTGMIEYPGFKTFDFKARGKGLNVPDIFGVEGKASGHAEIKATPQGAELTGTLHFARGGHLELAGLETNLTQHKTIQVVESSGRGNVLVLKGVEGPSPFLDKLAMDVRLELPPSGCWVTGHGLKAEINGGIRLIKKPAGPLLVAGALHAVRGVYSFHGKELKIVEGSVIFPGVVHTQPQLRIVCRKDIRDVTVRALVSGPLKHPKLTFSSIPVMNQVDIVSYFMFGCPAGDLSAAQSSQLQSGAAALLSSEGSNIVKSILGNSIIAPDSINYRSFNDNYTHMFSFDQDQTNIGAQTGIVEVGKNVTPNLHVVYGREVEGVQGSGNEVQVDYRVNKSLSVSSQVGGEQTGVDVFWRHDFGK